MKVSKNYERIEIRLIYKSKSKTLPEKNSSNEESKRNQMPQATDG
jgi:hypothetical protein